MTQELAPAARAARGPASAMDLRGLTEPARAGVLVEDTAGRVVYADAALFSCFGLPSSPDDPPGVGGAAWTDTVRTRLARPEEFAERAAEIRRAGRAVTGEEVRLADGRALEREYAPLIAGDAILGHLWRYRDAAGARARDALRESEARFRILFERSPDAVLLLDIEEPWRVVDCNTAACTMNGYSREEMIGMPVVELDPDAGRPEVCRGHIERLRRGDSVAAEAMHRRKDGTLFPIEYTTALIRIGGRELILGIDRDVTERRRAYARLAESERRFASLLSTTPAMVYRCGNAPDWPMEFASDYALTLTGYAARDFVAGAIRYGDLIAEGSRETVWCAIQDAVARREPFRLEYPIRRRDGAVRYVEEHGRAVYGEDGRFLALEGLVSDVTERRCAEDRTAAFAALGRRLSAATTAVAAARIIAEVSDALLGWDSFALLLYSIEDDRLHPVLDFDLVDGRRTESPQGGSAGPPDPSPGPISRRTIEEGPQLLLRDEPTLDLEGLRPFGDTTRPSVALMFVPIRAAGRVVGILTIQSYTSGAYTPADLGTLEALADHCGGALERIRAEEALRVGEASLANAQRLAHLGDWSADLTTGTVRWSDEYYRILGYEPGQVTPTYERFLKCVHPEDRERVREATGHAAVTGEPFEIEFRVARPDGEIRFLHTRSEVVRDSSGQAIGLAGTGHDVTERKALEERLEYLAFHDALTGLPNRTLLMSRLRAALMRAVGDGVVGVLYVDLDGYKLVNDGLGHEAGDEVLRHLAARLGACVRPEDTVARLSGDEFVVVIEDTEVGAAEAVAERILDRLRPAFAVGGREVAVGASVGVALSGPGREDPEALLRAADVALYRAKGAGKRRHAVYDGRPVVGAPIPDTEDIRLEFPLER